MKRLLPLAVLLLSALTAMSAPAVKREMRSAWLATVWGIDWPSVQGTEPGDIARQKAELIEILDRLKGAGLNAVNFQVRSMCDAMYRSRLEPWSRFLTGQRGKSPRDRSWDPLQFCVEQCHKRGMECHAWVNPFRFAGGALPSTSADMKMRNNGWVLTYVKKEKLGRRTVDKSVSILDPGNRDARAHIVAVCREIVTGYDIDGLVFDDYFYPEGLPLGKGYDFEEWQQSSGGLSQADWRRDNVRRTVADVYSMIQQVKPYVKFGISPAGVGGGNGKSSSRYGLAPSYCGNDWMYDGIYCDPLAWLEDGSVDYLSPQIYWDCDHSTNAYEPIARWWSEVTSHFGRHFYPSHSLTGADAAGGRSTVDDRIRQIAINREKNLDGAPGSMFYSVKHFSSRGKKADVASALGSKPFASRALTPPMSWKQASDPGVLTGLRLDGGRLQWDDMSGMRYAVYAVPVTVGVNEATDASGHGLRAEYLLDVSYESHYDLPSGLDTGYWYAVAPYDRYSNEWACAFHGQDPLPEDDLAPQLAGMSVEEEIRTDIMTTLSEQSPEELAEISQAVDNLASLSSSTRPSASDPFAASHGSLPSAPASDGSPASDSSPSSSLSSSLSSSQSSLSLSSSLAEGGGAALASRVADGYLIDLGCDAESARLFDSSGALVARGRGVRSIKAPSPGLYVLRIVDAAGVSITRNIEIPE